MNANILRNLSFHARRLRLSPTPRLFSFTASTSFSSRSHTPDTHKPHSLVQDITNEELKRRVEKLKEGDAEAIPSVFEAILQRYLAGKPIEADDELMREILGKGAGSEDEEDEFDSDWEETDDTDNEDVDLDFKGRFGVDEGKNKR
ncbi:uncharacterized protein LOC109801254 [Cajanus cajan]|uniref:uncharacterized protein LOC109801254 n=1 Tax=Cajanus cajan TaxID=3821 RepID=UPI00098D7DA9|nr:uncharacterized protein LOC109801254 [Cajanus cajan]